jgi:ribosome-binding factor A
MASRKLDHLNERIRHKLGTILQQESADPRFRQVTVTGVTLTKDLRQAHITYSTFDALLPHKSKGRDIRSSGKKGRAPAKDPLALTQALNRAAGYFAQALARTLETRLSPKLTFAYDPTFDHVQEMENLLKPLRAAGQMGSRESTEQDAGETPVDVKAPSL